MWKQVPSKFIRPSKVNEIEIEVEKRDDYAIENEGLWRKWGPWRKTAKSDSDELGIQVDIRIQQEMICVIEKITNEIYLSFENGFHRTEHKALRECSFVQWNFRKEERGNCEGNSESSEK